MGSRLLGREEETATRKIAMGRSKGKCAPSTWRDPGVVTGKAGIRVCQRRQRAQPGTPKGPS